MKSQLADLELKPMQEAEVNELLNQPIYLRVAMIDARDGTSLVHPIWYHYKDEKFFAVSNYDGTKIRSLKKNPNVYFPVDVADRGVCGKGKAKVVVDSDCVTKVATHNIMRYLGSIDGQEAKSRIEIAKKYYGVIEITPLYMATWKV